MSPGTGCWHVLHAGPPAVVLGAVHLGQSHGSGGARDTLTGTRDFIILLLSRGTHSSRWALQWGHEGGLNSSCCWGSSPAWDYQKQQGRRNKSHTGQGGNKGSMQNRQPLEKNSCHHLTGAVPRAWAPERAEHPTQGQGLAGSWPALLRAAEGSAGLAVLGASQGLQGTAHAPWGVGDVRPSAHNLHLKNS